jgi:coproporphyrinogen III oxidase
MEKFRLPAHGAVPIMPSENQKNEAAAWFEELRTRICAAFEQIEHDFAMQEDIKNNHVHKPEFLQFTRKAWSRETYDKTPGGGGVMALMKGRVFEKVGVNVSTVFGTFSPEFRAQIPGAADNGGRFWASGISLVAHPRNPHVPPVHMNTRHIITNKGWFGGGADLNPIIPVEKDTVDFHATLRAACNHHGSDYYDRYKAWCDEYFFIKHRQESRGVGGIFFDYHDTGHWQNDFAFTRDVGLAFLDIYPTLVRLHMHDAFTDADRQRQRIKRGRYVEFNLVYDRGTKFGLMTGGNTEAILMSLPPDAAWV